MSVLRKHPKNKIIMTRQEEIIEAARSRAERHQIAEMKVYGGDKCNYSYGRIYNSEMASFEAGAEWADEHPKSPWIAVEDKLPEIGQAVFIRTSKSNYGVSWIDYDLDWQGGVAYSSLIVTHWMPIPELPKE